MTGPYGDSRQGESDTNEPVTFTDKRRIDPETGEVRETASGQAPSGSESGAAPAPSSAESEEAADLKATLQRVKAEYDNYRKRSVRQEQAAADRAKAGVAVQLLPVLDDLERARSHGDLETGPLKSVADKLAAALQNIGLVSFGAEGDEFDPSLHEAVQHEGEGANQVLGTVMRQGYKLGDSVLRHAMVGVVDAVSDTSVPDTAEADTADNIDASASQASES